jgi:hypothetical protein
MKGFRKLVLGAFICTAFMIVATVISLSAIEYGRDLTATSLIVGAIGVQSVALLYAFVWGNRAEHGAP